MKIVKVLFVAAILLGGLSMARAEHTWNWNMNDRFAYTREGDRFLPGEFSLDTFGSYKRGSKNVGDVFDEPEHGVWGGGVGANYFFTRYVGVGADVTMHADGGKFIDSTSGNLILRLPIERMSLAPYVFGGIGGNFDPTEEWLAQAGVGLEFRLNPITGIFADGRYIWPDKSADYSLIRAGLRFVF